LISAKANIRLHITGREGNRLDLREGQQQQLDLPAWRRESMYDVIYITLVMLFYIGQSKFYNTYGPVSAVERRMM
jgi:hypothetical protein